MISNVTPRAKMGNYKITTVINKKCTNKKKSQKEYIYFSSSFQSRAIVYFYTGERTNTIDIIKQKQKKSYY